MINILKSEQYIKNHREETIDIMCRFAITDLLLFWSDNNSLNEMQQKVWLPYLNYMREASGEAINTSYSLKIPDNKQFVVWLQNRLNLLSNKELTASFLVSTSLKSIILGLLFLNRNFSVEDIFKAAFLEEIYQNELWGKDEEEITNREEIKKDLQKISEYLIND